MSRLIDANELQSEYKKYHDGKRSVLIDVTPTIDAVEVVRCKDCEEYQADITWTSKQKGWCYCTKLDQFFKPYDFCSYGKKRGDHNA